LLTTNSALLLVAVARATDLGAMDRGGTTSSGRYAEIAVGDQPVQKTSVVDKSLNPEWREIFMFRLSSFTDEISVQVWDQDAAGSDDFLGYCAPGSVKKLLLASNVLDFDSIPAFEVYAVTATLTTRPGKKDEKVTGQVSLSIQMLPDIGVIDSARASLENLMNSGNKADHNTIVQQVVALQAYLPPQPAHSLQAPAPGASIAATGAYLPPQPAHSLQAPAPGASIAATGAYLPPQPAHSLQAPAPGASIAATGAYLPPQSVFESLPLTTAGDSSDHAQLSAALAQRLAQQTSPVQSLALLPSLSLLPPSSSDRRSPSPNAPASGTSSLSGSGIYGAAIGGSDSGRPSPCAMPASPARVMNQSCLVGVSSAGSGRHSPAPAAGAMTPTLRPIPPTEAAHNSKAPRGSRIRGSLANMFGGGVDARKSSPRESPSLSTPMSVFYDAHLSWDIMDHQGDNAYDPYCSFDAFTLAIGLLATSAHACSFLSATSVYLQEYDGPIQFLQWQCRRRLVMRVEVRAWAVD
jgi:hypothetical protein